MYRDKSDASPGKYGNPAKRETKNTREYPFGGMTMEQFYLISDQIFSYVELGWKSFGWWFVLGGLSCTLIIGFGIFRSSSH
jgi:hypothetical protein